MKRNLLLTVLALLLAFSLAACSKVIISVPGDSLLLFNALRGSGGAAAQNAAPAANTPADAAPAAEAPATDAAPVTAAQPDNGAAAAPANNTPATNAAQNAAPANNTPAATEAPAKQTASNGAPSTKEEVINYYVTAYNKIATDAKTITRTYDYTKNYKDIVEVGGNSTLTALAGTLMKQFMKETTTPLAGDINSLPPIGVSKLSITPAQISTATCTDKGSTYEIVLKSTGSDDNYELDAQPGQGSAGVIGPLLRTEDVSGSAPMVKFEGLHAKYATGQVTATVDKASGHITELKFDVPCLLHFDSAAVAIVKVNNTELGLEFLQNWTIAY